MSNWFIVNNNSESPDYKKMIASGDDTFKSSCIIGPDQIWLEVPQGVAVGNCEVHEEEGVLSLVQSEDKSGPKWDAMRAERDRRLDNSDKHMWPDRPDFAANQVALEAYRQALRDLPSNTSDPDNVTWPEEP